MLVQPTDLLMQNMDMSEDNSKFHEYDEFDPLNGEVRAVMSQNLMLFVIKAKFQLMNQHCIMFTM